MHKIFVLLGLAVCLGGLIKLGQGLPAAANSGCYLEDDSGQIYDLGPLCQTEPVLQTGDIQVTLRWSTRDDLDLVVIDPDGDAVTFFNPRTVSGGRLGADANAFCESASSSPLENIFWRSGDAPPGQYKAVVTLAVPCGGPTTTEVDYSLTILSQGKTTRYEGVARFEAMSETPFTFRTR